MEKLPQDFFLKLLPQDLIIEILLWLPVKSLLRFRCLSNSMCQIINGRDFINSHLSKSSLYFNLHKLIFSDSILRFISSRKFHVCDVNLNLEEDVLSLGKSVSYSWKEVCGNCNGLVVLLSRSQLGLSLWNPSTRQCRDLPDCPFNVGDVRSYRLIASGLGYDDSVDDYKAFIMVHVKQKLESEIQVWIFGLKSNIWTRAQNFPYLQYQIFHRIGYFTTDACLNWLYRFNYEMKPEIVAFDMRKETFSIMPQPVCSKSEFFLTKLHVLEGFLAISYFFYPSSKEGGVLQADLYIRKKDGVDDMFTWTKLFSVLGYSKKEDKILLQLDYGNYLVLYDLKDKKFAKVEIDKDFDWILPTICVESLVPVTGGA